ncbi:diguanylate cyclase [Candidatus Omnitrophota bacterium]
MSESVKRVLLICADKDLAEIIYFCLEGWGYEVETLLGSVDSIDQIKAREPDVIIVDFPSSYKESLALCQEAKSDFVAKSIPLIVLIDKRQLRKHLLSLKHGIDDYLLKPPDPLDLRFRVEMALRRTQYSFYTNSLTNLSGGRIIEELIKSRLCAKAKFSCAHIDIDNFKYFNDRYGYIKGDRVIVQTAYILHQVMKKFRSDDDFLGHIGGDDFVFITAPEKAALIASEFIAEFDRLIHLHYSAQDRRRGFVSVEDRAGIQRDIPLMSVSVAIVDNANREFDNIVQINETLAEIKSFLKKAPGSKFMIERRTMHHGPKARASARPLQRAVRSSPEEIRAKPLGQILLEKSLITQESLEQMLDLHWRRDLPLGRVLKDMGIIDSDGLERVLSWQKT